MANESRRCEFVVIIPARLDSVRLPGKALAEIAGQPLVVQTLRAALRAGACSVHVATDHADIAGAVRRAGGDVVMTSAKHRSGTERLAEAVDRLALADNCIVVNLQGDEPAMPAICLAQVAELLAKHRQAQMATLWRPIDDPAQWNDPNVVKLVTDRHDRALYFSRAAIPHCRDGQDGWRAGRRHVGLYAYRAGALRQWSSLPPSELEGQEALEQLRALAAGWTIVAGSALAPVPAGVDTPEDLERMRRVLAERC